MAAEQKIYELWLKKTADDAEAQTELKGIEKDKDEIKDRFYRELSFGTAGLRGILGLGTNRMNIYTVGRATQGLARYILESGAESPTAAIAYDSRNCSQLFARHAACVFAANGVTVHLYRELIPTPALSYAVRELGCDTGVVITASHNPAAYNGFKAYDPNGCQIGPEQADAVQKAILETDLFEGVQCADFEEALSDGRIRYIPDEFVYQYIDRVFREAFQPWVCRHSELSVVYTPLNGAGARCVKSILERVGIREIHMVKEQEAPDGNFPTCPYPNPETKEALELGLALCQKTGADILLATDPDCDRVGVAVKHGGEYRILTGNELGVLLLDYICLTRKNLGMMPVAPVAIRSVVSSKLTDKVAESYGVELRSVLTGFKYVGEVIAQLEQAGQGNRFIFAFEESCGYLSGGYVRDKDAVDACMLTAEMASAYKLEGKTLVDALEDLYQRFGVWHSVVDNFMYEGAAGMKTMEDIMQKLRTNPPEEIGGDKVTAMLDYQNSVELANGESQEVPLPRTNMVELHFEGDNAVIIRPSGTEPKIKIYYTIVAATHQEAEEITARYKESCAALMG